MESAKQMQGQKQKETSPKKRPFDGKLNNHLPGTLFKHSPKIEWTSNEIKISLEFYAKSKFKLWFL